MLGGEGCLRPERPDTRSGQHDNTLVMCVLRPRDRTLRGAEVTFDAVPAIRFSWDSVFSPFTGKRDEFGVTPSGSRKRNSLPGGFTPPCSHCRVEVTKSKPRQRVPAWHASSVRIER